jgi:hypothetical protein
MHENDDTQVTAAKKPTLSELLQRSFGDDAVFLDEDTVDDHERWDDDEGAFGG